jgi:hypothetical protein
MFSNPGFGAAMSRRAAPANNNTQIQSGSFRLRLFLTLAEGLPSPETSYNLLKEIEHLKEISKHGTAESDSARYWIEYCEKNLYLQIENPGSLTPSELI